MAVTSGNLPERQRNWTATILLLVLLGAAAVVRLKAVDEWSLDLKPRPDALEYTLIARQLAHAERPVLTIDGRPYPSRYPYGTPLLFAPFAALAGDHLERVHYGVIVYSVLALGLTYLVGRQLVGSLGGLVALAITALSPEHTRSSVVVMSEIPSELMMLVIALVWIHVAREQRRLWGFLLLGLLAGFAGAIRYPNLLVLACLLGSTGVSVWRREPRAVAGLALLVIGAGLALSAQLLYNQSIFGAPFEDGYRYWEPNDYRSGHALLPNYFWQAFAADGPYANHGNFVYYGAELLGLERALYRPEVCVLALIGVILIARSRRRGDLLFLVWLPLITFLFYCGYFFRAYRMLVPILPFLAMLAARPIALLCERAGERRRWVGIWLVVPVIVLCALRSEGALSSLIADARRERERAALPAFAELRSILEPDALLVWDLPLSLGASLGSGFELMALSGDGVDRHLWWILTHGLQPIDGHGGGPVPLFLDRSILHPPSFEKLVHASRSGRKILLVHGYLGAATEMKQALAHYFTTRPYAPHGAPFFARGLWVFELLPIAPT